jgi:hypothetical protein
MSSDRENTSQQTEGEEGWLYSRFVAACRAINDERSLQRGPFVLGDSDMEIVRSQANADEGSLKAWNAPARAS